MKKNRQNQIIKILESEGKINTKEASELFDVSLATIRRDFDELEKADILIKKYGGAELNSVSAHSLRPFKNRQNMSYNAKEAIARRAIEFVSDSSILAIDAGSTLYALCKKLGTKKKLLVLCDDIHTAEQVLTSGNGENRVYMMGGFLTPYGTSSADNSEAFINKMSRIDIFFCCCDGASLEEGLTTDEQMLNDLKQLYLAKAKRIIALVDSSKFEKTAFYKMCSFSDLDVLITDSGTPKEIVEKIKSYGVNVIVVDV